MMLQFSPEIQSFAPFTLWRTAPKVSPTDVRRDASPTPARTPRDLSVNTIPQTQRILKNHVEPRLLTVLEPAYTRVSGSLHPT